MKFTALIALMATAQASDMHPIVRQDTPDAPVVNKKCTDDQEDDTVDTNRVSLCSTLSNCVTSDTPKVYKNDMCSDSWESCGKWEVPG